MCVFVVPFRTDCVVHVILCVVSSSAFINIMHIGVYFKTFAIYMNR